MESRGAQREACASQDAHLAGEKEEGNEKDADDVAQRGKPEESFVENRGVLDAVSDRMRFDASGLKTCANVSRAWYDVFSPLRNKLNAQLTDTMRHTGKCLRPLLKRQLEAKGEFLTKAEMDPLLKRKSSSLGVVMKTTTLYWASQMLTDSDCKLIMQLAAMGALSNLKELWLGYNQIGKNGVRSLCNAWSMGAMGDVTYLDLKSNQIGDEGVNSLATEMRSGALARMNVLDLSFNKIGNKGMHLLSGAMRTNASITDLSIGGNNIDADGMVSFARAAGSMRNLIRLVLGGNKIKDDGMKWLAAAIGNGGFAKLEVRAFFSSFLNSLTELPAEVCLLDDITTRSCLG